MAAFVTDLLKLYDNEVLVKTANCFEGAFSSCNLHARLTSVIDHLVRVILVVICCDHPAMCHVCGFSDSGSGKYFCTKDHLCASESLTIDDKQFCRTALWDEHSLFIFSAFPLCDGEDHRRLPNKYSKLETKKERDAFCAKHGVRDSELNRLPYWNPVRMAIVDPMHNILLGMSI